ncbi:MAG: GNAT family N-acetyltransferase [Chloroflexi bacterium]|nr:GNAT family N-acetyltransferase [Chloroflexota bacterium]
MTAGGLPVELREVAPGERERFFAMLADYLAELDAYELPWDPAPPVEAYRTALDADPGGQRIEWMIAGGERAGFLITRVVPDWPEEEREIGEVIECYVEPGRRLGGVGRAAVKIWLARMRAHGVSSVEASVLWLNTPARRFWERLGFEARAVQTMREP